MADEKHRIEIEQRVHQMVELMLANKWKTGATTRALAEAWGISYQRARELSAEASKIVRQELLTNVSMGIVPTLQKVMRRGRAGMKPGDLSAAVQAAKVLADMAGLNEAPSEPAQTETKLMVEFVSPERPGVRAEEKSE